MKAVAFAAMIAGVALCSPAQALEHKAVIDHDLGPIAADYEGSTSIRMEQLGSAGGAGRSSSLRCQWSASLTVERKAQVGPDLRAHRSMIRANALSGSTPGWCSERSNGIDQLIAARHDKLHAQMLAMVEQDRSVILAEADNARKAQPAG